LHHLIGLLCFHPTYLASTTRLQQQVCQQYYAPDVAVSFNDGMLQLSGQEQLVQLLRGLQLMARFKPEVLEISSTPEK
jgi:hypothetical protein